MENIAEVRDGRRTGKDHAHYIEADLLPGHIGMARVLASGANDAGLLFCSDGPVRSAVLVGLAGFNLDNDEGVVLTRNQVDFAGAGRHTVVSRDHGHAQALQEPLGDIFAPATEGLFRGHVAPPAAIAEWVREFKKTPQHGENPRA